MNELVSSLFTGIGIGGIVGIILGILCLICTLTSPIPSCYSRQVMVGINEEKQTVIYKDYDTGELFKRTFEEVRRHIS